jgi:hypothetical protein
LKNRFPRHPNEGQDREQAEITPFLPWLAMTNGELASSSTTCWEYYSDVVGKTLNIAGEFLRGLRNKNHFKTAIHGFGGGLNLIAGLIPDGPKKRYQRVYLSRGNHFEGSPEKTLSSGTEK